MFSPAATVGIIASALMVLVAVEFSRFVWQQIKQHEAEQTKLSQQITAEYEAAIECHENGDSFGLSNHAANHERLCLLYLERQQQFKARLGL